jgi:hypothetical protein
MIALNPEPALIAMALPPALAMGFLAAILMGQTQLFQFTRRPPRLSLGSVSQSWLLLAALAVVLARLAPLGRATAFITLLKQERARSTRKPVWSVTISISAAHPAVYAYLQCEANQVDLLYTATECGTAGASGTYDPLLFLASRSSPLCVCWPCG